MGLFDNWPYSNLHALNLDMLLKNDSIQDDDIQKLWDTFHDEIASQVTEYIQENLSQFLLGAMYIEEDTAIKLQRVDAVDSDHVYTSNNETISVIGR